MDVSTARYFYNDGIIHMWWNIYESSHILLLSFVWLWATKETMCQAQQHLSQQRQSQMNIARLKELFTWQRCPMPQREEFDYLVETTEIKQWSMWKMYWWKKEAGWPFIPATRAIQRYLSFVCHLSVWEHHSDASQINTHDCCHALRSICNIFSSIYKDLHETLSTQKNHTINCPQCTTINIALSASVGHFWHLLGVRISNRVSLTVFISSVVIPSCPASLLAV